MEIKIKVTNHYHIEIDCSDEERMSLSNNTGWPSSELGQQLRFAFQPQPSSTVSVLEEENDTLKQKVEGLEEIINYLRILATAISPGRKEPK